MTHDHVALRQSRSRGPLGEHCAVQTLERICGNSYRPIQLSLGSQAMLFRRPVLVMRIENGNLAEYWSAVDISTISDSRVYIDSTTDSTYRRRLPIFWNFTSAREWVTCDHSWALGVNRLLRLLHDSRTCIPLEAASRSTYKLSLSRIIPMAQTHAMRVCSKLAHNGKVDLQGFNGYLLGHQASPYGLDATLMLTMMILFNFVHPSGVVVGPKGEETNRDTLYVHLESHYHSV